MLAGHSVLFRSAAALLEQLHRQSPEGRRRKLRTYANVGLLCIDEVGYLSFDDKAADLLYEVVNCRYERKPLIITTNARSRNGTRSSPTPLVSLRCSTACCITATSSSSRATAIASAKANRNRPPGGKTSERSRIRRCAAHPLRRLARHARAAQSRRPLARTKAVYRSCSPNADRVGGLVGHDPPPLAKIRSLAYFLPVIEELKLQPLPDGYLHYFRLKLRRLSA